MAILLGSKNPNLSGCSLKNIASNGEKISSTANTVWNQQAIAKKYINYLSGVNNLPDPIVAQLPIDIGTAFVGGGVAPVDSTNFTSTGVNDIYSSRLQKKVEYDNFKKQYESQYEAYRASLSIGLSNLMNSFSSRNDVIKIPSLRGPDGNIINAAPSSSSSSSKNKAPVNYITNDQMCTSMEIEKIAATWRTQANPSTKSSKTNPEFVTSEWQNSVLNETKTGLLAKEEVILLAEIREQLFNDYLQQERILATLSAMQMNTLSTKSKDLLDMYNKMQDTINEYIEGGKSEQSSTSSS